MSATQVSANHVGTDVSHRAFFIVMVLLFGVSASVTIVWGTSMAEMGGMQMPDGWTMSMAWMRMPDQTWLDVGASFIGMWVVMMAAMMLPSLTPMLWRYRQSIAGLGGFGAGGIGEAGIRSRGFGVRGLGSAAFRSEAGGPAGFRSAGFGSAAVGSARLAWLTWVAGCGYFAVWTLIGALAFPLGAALAALEMREPSVARAVPLAVGVVVLMAGALQFTAWKARALACCRGDSSRHGGLGPGALTDSITPPHGCESEPNARSALRLGIRLGLRCSACCAGLTAILLVIGVMDLRAMTLVTVAITAERLSPGGERVARIIGMVVVAAGLFLIGQSLRT